jgi:RNA polymerase sigma factor (sigma-70 family)
VDASGLEESYDKYAAALVRFATTIVGPVEAEDLVAGVMFELLRSPERTIDDPRAYLYRSVANAARKHFRSLERRERREALTAPHERYEHHEFVPEVLAALGQLSPQQRAVIHLTYWEDLTPAAVAARLGVGDGSVRRQLARARRRLGEVLRGSI